ncbi:hypothetical protein ES703_53546 [subsurface metagenome]|nr:hypothetical protein [bacterium]
MNRVSRRGISRYEDAKKIAEEGYVLSMDLSSYYEKDFAHRMERLNQKMRRQKEKKAEPKKKETKKKSPFKS